MPLAVTVNTIAECLRTDCNVLGDNNNKKVLVCVCVCVCVCAYLRAKEM